MNPIKITNFKGGEILFYQLQKLSIFILIIAVVSLTAPLVRPNKFSYDFANLFTSLFLIFLWIIYLFFERYLFFISLDKEKEELNIEFHYLFRKKELKIKFSELSYQIQNRKSLRYITLFSNDKKRYTIYEDEAGLEEQQIDYLLKLLKEYNIRSK